MKSDGHTTSRPEIRLLAHGSVEEKRHSRTSGAPPSYFTSAQWTADGTTILTGSSDHVVSAWILPSDLLEVSEEPRELAPHGVVRLPEPTQTITPAPYFSLADRGTQTFLTGCKDHPIQLYDVFSSDEGRTAPLATYKLIRKETEEYITPSSMIWLDQEHFLCGSTNRLDYFNLSGHSSDDPVTTIHTIPSKRHLLKGGGVGMKGTVSALGASPAGTHGGSVVAAGTWTRWLGLYDLYRSEKKVANWSIAQAADDAGVEGNGISQTIWSSCGRYLLVNERQSAGMLVYDVRVTGQLLSVLKGRQGLSHQKMMCDIYPGNDGGNEVWIGDKNGTVHVWEGVGLHGETGVEPSWSWQAHEAPVGSTIVHSSGSVTATCSGGWEPSEGDVSGISVLEESSLKIWSIGASYGHAEDEVTASATPAIHT